MILRASGENISQRTFRYTHIKKLRGKYHFMYSQHSAKIFCCIGLCQYLISWTLFATGFSVLQTADRNYNIKQALAP